MPKCQAAVDLVAKALATEGLFHPGDENTPSRPVNMPGFRNTGMSDEQTQEFVGQAAKIVAESIVHLIEAEFELLTKADAAQLRQDAADAPDGTRILTFYDRADHQLQSPLWQVTIGKTDNVMVNPALLRKLTAQ
ncbi:hypothetical protein [Mycobacteroides saopaulense]|uniref:Uncharacterized protein n=1 Tax=Mycobacteroides saopaulense TaxID=1578165 RepID=A0ABX3BYE3_9MYCO|nr:hypothetical protein [Mycobacteroides saopaulense]OHT86913.1 hypothetical protein BKG68_12575 [Mycobacteroides saopaulense]OHU08768.1 hypothetical protein BKG73_17265 [Mycobacteroides saopaulense]